MALPPRLYALGAAALVLLGLGAGATYYLMAGKLAASRAERDTLAQALAVAAKQRKADQALLARRAAANASAARESAALRQRLDAALFANREWADQPVPAAVRESLEKP